MTNSYGRQVVIPAVNKSGGGVVAGDVVIFDASNDGAFTTQTSAQAEKSVGVAQETIANNATGRVLVAGYAALINVPSSVTRGHYVETYSAVKQASGSSARRAGSFGVFLTGGTTPTAVLWGQTDQTASGGSGISSGSSFPGSPSTHDLFYRSDRDLLYFYDGTRWLTVNLYRETLGQSATTMPVSTNNQSLARMTPWASTYDLWLDAFYSSTFPAGTNTGSHYWTMTLQKADLSDSKTTVTSFNTSAHTASNWTQVRTAIGASYTASSYRELDVQATVTGSPGSIYWVFALAYRLIG